MSSQILFCPACDRLLEAYTEFIESGDWLTALDALKAYDAHRDQAHGPGGYPA